MADEPFTWGMGGARLTPEEIASRRKVADALALQAGDGSPFPIGTRGAGLVTQGLARVSKGLLAGLMERRNTDAAQANADDNKQMIASLLGSGTQAAVTPAPASAPVVSTAPDTADNSAPRGIRNNNPLNIEDGDFAKSQPGYLGSDGRFARFETSDHGVAAADTLLNTYQTKHGLNTVSGIVGRWAPAADGNNVSAYATDVATRLGIDPNAPLTPAQRPALIAAMGQHENGRPIVMPGAPVQTASNDPSFVPAPAVAKVAAAMPGAPTPTAPAADDEEATPASPAVAKIAAAMPGASVPTASVPATPTAPVTNPNVAKVSAAIQAFTSPYADPQTKQVAGMLLQQGIKPQVGAPYKDADGNLVQKAADGTVHMLVQAEKDPKWGIIGKDQYGQPTYGYAPSREEYAAAQKAKVAAPPIDQPDLTNVHGKEYMDILTKQDPKYASQVQSIIEGRAPYPTGMLLKTPYGQKLAQDVTQADQTFEAGNATARVKVRNEFESGGVGSPAGQISAGNTAIQHAGEMSDALERMKADEGVLSRIGQSGVPFISKWANELHNAAVQGTPEGKSLNDFMTAKNHFSEEVTKFYAGSAGSEAERARALANLDAAKSLPELRSAIKTEVNLMQGKVNALQNRWRTGMGPLVSDFQLIHPESQAAMDRVLKRDASSDAPAPVAPVATAIPAPAVAKLAQNPTAEMKAHFDEVFGAGAADRALTGSK